MRIGIPRETKPGENRIAITPSAVRVLRESGTEIVVEAGAGAASGFETGIPRCRGRDRIAGVAGLVGRPRGEGQGACPRVSIPVGIFHPLTFLHLAAFPQLTEELLTRRITAVAYETVTSAGALPILRPMSEVAGILSIQVGARDSKEIAGDAVSCSPGRTTSRRECDRSRGRGGRPQRRANRRGDRRERDDPRREPGETFRGAARMRGRARTVLSSPDAVAGAVKETDLLVSTVLVAGERAPCLVTREMIRSMRPGAVAVDIAIDQGGSVETSRPTTHAALTS